MTQQDSAEEIARATVIRIRNDILITVYHHLKDKVSAIDLARLYGIHPEQIHNGERRKYGKKEL